MDHINGDGNRETAPQYLLGIDKLLEPVIVRFFADGHVCGVSSGSVIRFQGKSSSDGQVDLTFLPPPPPDKDDEPTKDSDLNNAGTKPADPSASEDEEEKAAKKKAQYILSLFGSGPSGSAHKTVSRNLIIWEGRLEDGKGKSFDFYFKRPRSKVDMPIAAQKFSCGEATCDPLEISIVIKKGSEGTFRRDASQLQISSIRPLEGMSLFYG